MDFEAFTGRLRTRLASCPPRPAVPDGALRHAAVVALFRGEATACGGPEILLIRRAEAEGDPWSGHVAFPGGRVDPEDPDPLAAAQRELLEEVGIDLRDQGRLLGELPRQLTLPLAGRRMVVHPFVFALDGNPPAIGNGEVARILWVPFRELLEGVGQGQTRWTWQGQELTLPCRRLHGELLWGMTLRMVEDLLRAWGDAPA